MHLFPASFLWLLAPWIPPFWYAGLRDAFLVVLTVLKPSPLIRNYLFSLRFLPLEERSRLPAVGCSVIPVSSWMKCCSRGPGGPAADVQPEGRCAWVSCGAHHICLAVSFCRWRWREGLLQGSGSLGSRGEAPGTPDHTCISAELALVTHQMLDSSAVGGVSGEPAQSPGRSLTSLACAFPNFVLRKILSMWKVEIVSIHVSTWFYS